VDGAKLSSILRRSIRKLVAYPFVTRLFAPFIARVDRPILRLTKGHFSPSGFIAGWPVINLTTIGAKSGLPRTTPVIGIPDGQKIILIATNFGKANNPAWYYNLKSNPNAAVSFQGRSVNYTAIEANESEREICWQMADATYHGYSQYRRRAKRTIPIMILEPEE
jgi:deazaflavin-dependent oxidoreductase (nitroreductase family)